MTANVTVTFTPVLKDGETLPDELAEFDGTFTFHFPAVRVARGLDKDLKIINFSGQTRAIDLMRVSDSIRLMGYWRDDTDAEYDGLTSIDRVNNLYLLNTFLEMYGEFTWSSGTDTETLRVMSHDFNCDSTPGEGDLIQYNFLFAVVDE